MIWLNALGIILLVGQIRAQTYTCYYYNIASGDTFTTLAARCNNMVTAQTIANNNPTANPNNLQICQQVCLPCPLPSTASCPGGTSGTGTNTGTGTGTGTGTTATCSSSYSVAPGDTLNAIASRCGTTASTIAGLSGIANPDLIYPCQRLCLPAGCNLGFGYNYCSGGPVASGTGTCAASYTVAPGDSLTTIANACGTTVSTIQSMNPSITNANLIYPCQVLCMPTACSYGLGYTNCATGVSYAGASCASNYYVAPGDTLGNIATRCGTTAAAIAANSGISNANLIYPCQRLCLPVGCNIGTGYTSCATSSASRCAYTYTVSPGDTLTNIANACGTTATTIAQLSGIANANLIYPCQVVCLPNSCNIGTGYSTCASSYTGAGNCAYTYSVAPGDTLSAIASRCGTTAAAIGSMNGIANLNLIYPCQRLCLPAGCYVGAGYNYCPPAGYVSGTGVGNTGYLPPIPAAACAYSYTIAPGDTLNNIAAACGTTATTIASMSGISDPNVIHPCQVVCLPNYCPNVGVGYTACATGISYPANSCSSTYYVAPGDTLGNIANRCGTTASTIAGLSGISNINLIYPCQRLCLPNGCNLGLGYTTCSAPVGMTNGGWYGGVTGGPVIGPSSGWYGSYTGGSYVSPYGGWYSGYNGGYYGGYTGGYTGGYAGAPYYGPTGAPLVGPTGYAPYQCASTYTVAPGDTLYNIASRCGTTAATIGSLNGIANLNLIYPCQVLCMPFSCMVGVGYTSCSTTGTFVNNNVNTCAYSYSVAPGDTLNAIASRCGTTASTIAGLSGITNPNLIYPCQRLCLPAGCNLGVGYNYCPTNQCAYTYTVAPGNSLASIATACGTTALAIANMNGIAYNSIVNTCQVLCMPSYCAAGVGYGSCATATTFNAGTTTCSSYYTVAPGDTLGGIASRCGLTAYDIANVNGITNINLINPCQHLCLPAGCNIGTGYASCPVASGYTPSTYSCAYTYTIAPGDTLNGIASTCGTTAATIASLSGIANPNVIYPCQVICLPASCPITFNTYSACNTVGTNVYPACAQYYTVQPTNTCGSISTMYSTFNPSAQGINCNALYPGQVVCVAPNANPGYLPTYAPTYNLNPACTSYYVVQPGSTCCSIASAYPNFYSLNPLANCNALVPGQTFCVSAANTYIPNNAATCNLNYVIRSTDTCATLLAQYPQFYSINPTINCNALPVGSTVCVSSNTNSFAYNPTNFNSFNNGNLPSNCPNSYTLVAGDTCSSFTTAAHLLTCNPNINCNALTPGQVVYY